MSKKQFLDKYYTKKSVAQICFNNVIDTVKNEKEIFFIEPSAGSGVFNEIFNENNYLNIGFDIEPTNDFIIKNDFLEQDIKTFLPDDNYERVFIGNPPFGKRSKLAIDFVNKSFEYGNYVAFILPIQFRKYLTQNKIKKEAKLISDINLPKNSFTVFEKDYNLRCCFQIWYTGSQPYKNLRILNKPPTKHPNFEMYQYNNTESTLKYFDYDWDFAVLRQGWGDFNTKYYKKEELDYKKQWMFFKAKDKRTLEKLKNINFNKVSEGNTQVNGFGKADIIKAYNNFW